MKTYFRKYYGLIAGILLGAGVLNLSALYHWFAILMSIPTAILLFAFIAIVFGDDLENY